MGGLASLEELYISEVPNLISLPEGIYSLTSLCTPDISKWPNLTSLPEWMGGLACLETLYISECPNLASLPKGMHGLTSLKTLCNVPLSQQQQKKKKNWKSVFLMDHTCPPPNTLPHHSFSLLSLSFWLVLTSPHFSFLSFSSFSFLSSTSLHSLILSHGTHSKSTSPPSFFRQDHRKIFVNP